LKNLAAKELFEKGAKLQGFNPVEDKGEIESLMVN
jgi:hypothetical protein